MFAKKLDRIFAEAIAKGGSEPEIVKAFTVAANAIPSDPDYMVKAGFIHQRPYAFFVQPQKIAGRGKCEFGDILYVFKEFLPNGDLVKAKAVFVQVKKGHGHWGIEPHQLEFLANINSIQFRFGNAVYKNGGYAPVIFNGLPCSDELSQYLLFDDEMALSYSVARVKQKQPLYQHGFPLHVNNPIRCLEADVPFCTNHDSNLNFLERFCNGEVGGDLTGELWTIVDLIYKKIGWVLDPPEEFADNFIDDPRGFAIVEVTRQSGYWQEEPDYDPEFCF